MFEITSAMKFYNDDTYQAHVDEETKDNRPKGQEPRNFKTHAVGYCKAIKPFNLKLIPDTEQQGKLDYFTQTKSTGADLRDMGKQGTRIPTKNQGQKGYCWAHSPVTVMQMMRAQMGEPWADLSAYSVACPIKNFRDEGGWNAQAVGYIAENGCATSRTWAQQSMDRSCIQASAEERMHFRYVDWLDLDPGEMEQQMITVLLSGGFLAADFNWWSHSVAVIALLSISPIIRVLIMNSWGDDWSQAGLGILEGRHAVPSAATALQVAYASAA